MFRSTSLFLLLPVNKSYIYILPNKGYGNAKGSVSEAASAAGGKLRNEYRSHSMPDKFWKELWWRKPQIKLRMFELRITNVKTWDWTTECSMQNNEFGMIEEKKKPSQIWKGFRVLYL